MTYTIRQATTSDIPAVSLIFQSLNIPNNAGWYYFCSSDMSYITKIIKHQNAFVVKSNDTICAAFVYRIEENSCEIVSLAVASNHRWQGIWTYIINHLIDICTQRTIPKIRCWSIASLNAVWFYTKMWFEEQYLLRKQFYNQDVWIFGKNFT